MPQVPDGGVQPAMSGALRLPDRYDDLAITDSIEEEVTHGDIPDQL